MSNARSSGKPESTNTLTLAELQSAPGSDSRGVVLVCVDDRACAPHPMALSGGGSVVLGRDAGSVDVHVDDLAVSRQHARLDPDGDGWLVTDLGSHNGTYVNGVRADAALSARAGDALRLGRSIVVVADAVERASTVADADGLVGGAWLASALALLDVHARTEASVLIHGETGTGKELFARRIHQLSGRTGVFLPVNCATLPKDLVESELFGHAKGAFSDAASAREGLFRAARHGTLFLDELGELSLRAQATLLRALEERAVRPVGEDRLVPVDVRVVCATNRELAGEIDARRFRSDLFHRVAAVRVELPPLCERPVDVPRLAARVARDSGVELSCDALERLMCRDWPGNVRELEHVVRAAAVRARAAGSSVVDPAAIDAAPPPPSSRGRARSAPPAAEGGGDLRERVVASLQTHGGNVTRVARELGMRRARLYDVFRELGIDPASFRPR